MPTRAEAIQTLTAPGGMFEIGEADVLGERLRVYANAPASLRDVWASTAVHAANTFFVYAGERTTYAEAHAKVRQLATHLLDSGIAKGDRVAIAMRNCPSWIVSYMAIVKAGGIATLLNGWWEPAEMEQAIRLSAPTLIIADPPRAKRIAERCSDCTILSIPIDLPIDDAMVDLLHDRDENSVLPEMDPEDDATILFTSGSTGDSKGALSTHRAVTTATYAYATGLIVLRGILESEGNPPPTPRTLLSVPLFHVTGEVPVMINSFVIGRCMVVMPKWDVTEALRLIEKEGITYFVGVPTMSLELLNHPDRDKYDLSSLRDITAGGAPRPISHVERLREEFPWAQPALGYGLTETNAAGFANYWSNYAAKPASTGRAQVPYIDGAIIGPENDRLPPGEAGEIVIKSAANIKCYWNNPAATAAAFTQDGYFRTGDIGYLDEDGYLFIVDRKKEIIIRGGENISAAEVEAACYAYPAVAEASVFGAPDERLGEVPVAVILIKDGEELAEQDLLQFLDGKLAKFKIPARVIFSASSLPRLGTGKIDRRALKAQYAQ
jgi:long-chain acyl-CoA synthetase